MKINRLKLIDLVKVEIARRVELTDKENAQRAEKWARELEEYEAQTTDAWKEFGNTIIRAVRRGEVLSVESVPPILRKTKWNTGVELRFASDTPPLPISPNVRHLNALLSLLESSDDDVVSTYSLEKSGFPLGQRLLRGDS